LFIEPFDIGKPLEMAHQCGVCKQNFEPEPGYYFGAMFISYALSVILLLPITLLLVFYFDWSINSAIAIAIFLGAVSFIKILRLSRSLWINIMVKYQKKYDN